MMERMREGVNSIAVKIVLSLIILSFLFAGVGSYLTGGSVAPAAIVGSQEISQAEFEQAYQNERQQMQAQAGEFFASLLSDPAYLAQFRLSVLDRMVNQSLLDQYATQLGLNVSDEQIKQAIRAMPAFANNGIFNNDMYLQALRRNGLAPEQFAAFVRQDLIRTQLISALQQSEFALDTELTSLYDLEAQIRTVRSLTLPVADFSAKITPTEAEEKAFYAQNSAQFVRPEQYKISYVELSANSVASNNQISDAQALKYYEENQSHYGKEQQRKVSHIMIQGVDAAAQKKAADIVVKLQQGADFAQLAKEFSEDTFSAAQGGQLDWFDKGVMDPAFEQAAYALVKPGDVTVEAVKSAFGYHIIKLDEIKEAQIKPFAEVKAAIVTQLQQQQAAENFHQLSTLLAEKAFELPDSLDDAAQAIGASVQKTDFASIQELQGALAQPKVRQALQQPEVRQDGLNSELIELAPEHVVVVRIDETRPEAVLPFEQVRADIAAIIKQTQGQKAAQQLADELLAQLRANDQSGLAKAGVAFGAATEITRNAAQAELADVAFTMPLPQADKPSYALTTASNGDILLVALDAVAHPKAEPAKLKNEMAQKVITAQANSDLTSLLGALKQKIKVDYNVKDMQ